MPTPNSFQIIGFLDMETPRRITAPNLITGNVLSNHGPRRYGSPGPDMLDLGENDNIGVYVNAPFYGEGGARLWFVVWPVMPMTENLTRLRDITIRPDSYRAAAVHGNIRIDFTTRSDRRDIMHQLAPMGIPKQH